MAVTAEQLIERAKEAADLTNVEDFVTDATWLQWCNDGVRELHRYVTNKFKATYYRTFDFTLAEGEFQQTLPSNFWRLKGLDIDAATVRRREVRPFNFADRHKYQRDPARQSFAPYCNDRVYNLVGSSLLQVQAQEHAAGDYRLYYVPKPKELEAVRTIVRAAPSDQVLLDVDGVPSWLFANFDLTPTSGPVISPDIGKLLTITGAAEDENNGSRLLTAVASAVAASSGGDIVAEVFGGGVVATLATVLDDELDNYSEYVWLTAAIKALTKEESFAQARELKEQRNLIRVDLSESLETDQGGPATIIDTDGDDW